MRDSLVFNYLLYQAGWFASVLGAAWHQPWLGFGVALALLGVQLALSKCRKQDAALVAFAVVTGTAVELVHMSLQTYHFTSGAAAGLPPAWMLVMWAQFAATFRFSLKPVVSRPAVAALFGAIGGPLAFVAGDALGAITLQPPLAEGLLWIAVSWTVAVSLLAAAARQAMTPAAPNPGIGI